MSLLSGINGGINDQRGQSKLNFLSNPKDKCSHLGFYANDNPRLRIVKAQTETDYNVGGLNFSRVYRSDSTWTDNTIGNLCAPITPGP